MSKRLDIEASSLERARRDASQLDAHTRDEGVEFLHDIFETQVDRTPNAVAIRREDRTWSYLEVDRQANAIARDLRNRGVETRELVGLHFHRGEWPLIAILAILKAGATYVPIDPAHPEARIRDILDDAGIARVVTQSTLESNPAFEGRACICVDAPRYELDSLEPAELERLDARELGLSPLDLCYVLYTSGSTGRPKGVMTEHRNVVHFVSAFDEVCQMQACDRVYQGFSLGFDGSVEEMWMAYRGGASLVVGDDATAKVGSEVAALVRRHGVTFFSTVPTFLSLIPEDLPSLRLLIVSGEQCPLETVNKWATEGRTMLNVYGPTETTVNTTAEICVPGKAITVGKALRGYELHILDESGTPVSPGESGELFIGGPTVSRGYLRREELTAKHFVPDPFAPPRDGESPRMYRTGDRVRFDEAGDLVFLGRLDSQVKVRGYRVELSEIESLLLEHADIQAAVVSPCEVATGVRDLAAYVVARDGVDTLDRGDLHEHLSHRLPSYMVPRYLEQLDEMPMLASGKADRKRLPHPERSFNAGRRVVVNAQSQLEACLVAAFEECLQLGEVSVTANFFDDLGGHSLVAAKLVTSLRDREGLDVAVRDLYRNPSVRQLAHELAERAPIQVTEADEDDEDVAARRAFAAQASSYPWVVAGQALASLGLYGINAIPAALTVWLAVSVYGQGATVGSSVLLALLALGVFYPLRPLLCIAAKWLIIGRYEAGSYPLWSSYYFRFWLATRIQAASGSGMFAGTPLMSWYFRMMGAKIGRDCTLDSGLCACYDLIDIGDGTSIGSETQLLGYRVEDGYLHVGPIKLGKRNFVGVHSNLGLDVEMGDDCLLGDVSALPDGARIEAGSELAGSPPRPTSLGLPEVDTRSSEGALWSGLFWGVNWLSGLLSMAIAAPGVVFIVWASLADSWLVTLAAVTAVIPASVLIYCAALVVLKWLVLPRSKVGAHPQRSFYYLRKWFVDGLVRGSLQVMRPLYTTMFLPPWLRLMGAKIGARAEIATVSQISPELLDIGAESFLADGSMVGGRRFWRGHVVLDRNQIGRRSFVGNSAMLSQGDRMADECLLGCLSVPPRNAGERRAQTPAGSEWLGSPSFALPRREPVPHGFSEAQTYRPTAKLYVQRFGLDCLRIAIPVGLSWGFGTAFIMACYQTLLAQGPWLMVALSPVYAMLAAFAASGVVIGCKWMLMGRFEAVRKPLWSPYVWLNEVVNGAYESVFAPALAPLLGTPFFAPFLRAMGCRVGRRCFIETTLFSEFDLVEIGDDVALNAGVIVQNHLFEDRIMKSSNLRIGDGASVGNMSVVLYDSEMAPGARLGPLSLLMKGERIGGHRHGIPSQAATLAPSARSRAPQSSGTNPSGALPRPIVAEAARV